MAMGQKSGLVQGTLDMLVVRVLSRGELHGWGITQKLEQLSQNALRVEEVSLAAIGIYGVTAYSVAQRSREIGVRMALGAGQRAVLQLILGRGARLAIWGAGLGVLGALALPRLLRTQLYQVSSTDPEVFLGAAGLLIAIALVASWLPARRATKVDPMAALRAE